MINSMTVRAYKTHFQNPQYPDSDQLFRADIYTISVEECNTGADAGRNRYYQICTLGHNNAGPCQVCSTYYTNEQSKVLIK